MPNLLAASAAQRTKRIRLLIYGNLLPLHQPLRLAEELAMLDCLSRGRLICGIARGIPREYQVHNVPMSQSRERFEEAYEIVTRAWTEDVFSYSGKYWSYKDVALWPRPLQKPHPPIMIPIVGSQESIEFAGRHNIGITPGLAGGGLRDDIIRHYAKSLKAAGHRITPDHLSLALNAYVADSKAQAVREVAPYHLYFNRTLFSHGSFTETAAQRQAGYVEQNSTDYVRPENQRAAALLREDFRNMSFESFQKQAENLPYGTADEVAERIIAQAEHALKAANANTPVGVLDGSRQTLTIQANRQLKNAAEFGRIVVASRNTTPILVRDVAHVSIGAVPRLGIVGQDEDDDVVTGIVIMRKGENPSVVLAAVKAKLEDLKRDVLPKDVEVAPFYDRSWLIDRTLKGQVRGKVVLITGGSTGIGAETARLLAERGAKVAIAARRKDKLDEVVAQIAEHGGTARAYALDVTDKSAVKSVVAAIVADFGRLDVLINNAGLMPIRPMAEVNTDEWDQMIDVNLKGTLYGIAAALPGFLEQGSGHIINLSSVAGIKVFAPGGTVYSGTKFAVSAISEGLRHEVGEKVRVTSIEPGAVESDLKFTTSGTAAETVLDFYKQAIPAASVARAIAFAVEQPDDVDVNAIVIRPTAQQF